MLVEALLAGGARELKARAAARHSEATGRGRRSRCMHMVLVSNVNMVVLILRGEVAEETF